jgi:hypothetical protein
MEFLECQGFREPKFELSCLKPTELHYPPRAAVYWKMSAHVYSAPYPECPLPVEILQMSPIQERWIFFAGMIAALAGFTRSTLLS